MDPLATIGDLEDRQIDTSNAGLAYVMLGVASAAVRGAAGSPISETTSTITYDGYLFDKWLRLSGQPVTTVTAVTVDGDTVSDWRLSAAGRLWRGCGWGTGDGPTPVVVTQTHGMPVVPADIVNLVCSYTAAGIAAAKEQFDDSVHAGKIAERIDDYSVNWAQGADAVATAMEIPAGTRAWLSSMFGGAAAVVAT